MALSNRLNQIISEQNISKTEFARRLGITVNYVYILTGNSRPDTDLQATAGRIRNKIKPFLQPSPS